MRMIMDDVRGWKQEFSPGPRPWQDAWERVFDLVDPLWGDWPLIGYGVECREAEAAAALAVAFYILTAERELRPQQVTRADVEQLLDRSPSASSEVHSYPRDLPERWGARLAALGHDLDADDDPVAACWRRLRIEYPEPPMAFIDAGDTSLHRVGTAVIEGISYIFAPINRGLQF